MKSVTISPAIQANPQLLAQVQRATNLLELELAQSAPLVSASWELRPDELGRNLVRLVLADWTGQVETYFVPEDLRDEWKTQGRMIRLWGDLLQVRSHKLLEPILESIRQGQGVS